MKRSEYLRQKRAQGKRQRSWWWLGLAIPLLCLCSLGIYRLPPVYEKLSWRVEEWQSRIYYYLNPPSEVEFLSEDQDEVAIIVQATLQAIALTDTAAAGAPTLPPAESTPLPTFTPTVTPTPLPGSVILEGVEYVHQHGRWNYCAPANLTMALKFWGWGGNRDDVGMALKPGPNDPDMDFVARTKVDKNVMLYEMENYVNYQTELSALYRYGGNLNLIKHLIANGFPVLIEKGNYAWSSISRSISWMGHYLFVTGYDDAEGVFIVQDSLEEEDGKYTGNNFREPYPEFITEWRSFNYAFMIVYPPERESEVMGLLGPWADRDWANQHALDFAQDEITKLKDLDLFFAWFNKGTSHVQLKQYVDAKDAYKYAFLLYSYLPEDDTIRPWRIMWYQTGPYFAYFYSVDYEAVINLATTTLNAMPEPTLEESFYWRGMARWKLGETDNAISDFRQSVYLNPNFTPGWEMLEFLGVGP